MKNIAVIALTLADFNRHPKDDENNYIMIKRVLVSGNCDEFDIIEITCDGKNNPDFSFILSQLKNRLKTNH
jgi:hypothetical protein